LTDHQAPWHGFNGYVGTPLYQSPEHILGKVPLPASDVFTCGIMLGQLLGHGHPFTSVDQDKYSKAIVEGWRLPPVKIQQSINKVDDLQFVETVINSCLNPDPSRRPTAKQVADALMGKTFDWNDYKPEIKVETPPVSPIVKSIREPAATGSLNATTGIAIYFGDRNLTTANIDASFGKYTFKGVHDDAQFLSEKQFKLYRDGGSKTWMIAHDSSATNETLVNGKKLNEPLPVTEGMKVAVGNSAKGIEKFVLTLRSAK
jgi:serine/threonine protein kinase